MSSADVIIADLTNNNANVFYELGICHTKNKKVIMITQNIDLAPFDLKQYVLEPYTRDIDDVEKFHNSLSTLLEEMENNKITFENPVEHFWSNKFISVEAIDVKLEDESEQDEYEDGLLDLRMKLENSSDAIQKILETVPRVFDDFSKNMNKHTHDIESANKSKNNALVYRIVNESAQTLQDFSKIMESTNNLLEPQIEDFNLSLYKISELSDLEREQNSNELMELVGVLRDTIKSTKDFNQMVISTKRINLSKSFNKSADKLIQEISRQIKTFSSIEENICKVYPSYCLEDISSKIT